MVLRGMIPLLLVLTEGPYWVLIQEGVMKGKVSAVRLCQAENISRNPAMNHDERPHVGKG